MKKLLTIAIMAAAAAPLCAQDIIDDEPESVTETAVESAGKPAAPRKTAAQWPVFLAFCEFPETPDMVGLRLTVPFSTKQESVTGFDVGLWGRTGYFEGLMLSVIRNDVKDEFAGFQVGLYNSIGHGDCFAMQVGLWNEAISLSGIQCGLVNTVGEAAGFQFGLINRAESLYGAQVGLINVIRDNELTFCPFANIGF